MAAVACAGALAERGLAQSGATSRRITSAPVSVTSDTVDFGDVRPQTTVRREATIVNESDEPIRIRGVRVSCGCTVADWPETWIDPGDSATVELTFDSGDLWGPVQRYVLLQFEGYNQPLRIMTTAHVNTGVRVSRSYEPMGQTLRGVLTLQSTDGQAFRVLGLSFAEGGDDAEAAPGRIDGADLDPALGEPALTHEVAFDFSAVEAERLRRWVGIATDHPTASVLAMHLDNPFAAVDRRRTMWLFSRDHLLLGTVEPGGAVEQTVILRGIQTEIEVQEIGVDSELLGAEVVETTLDAVQGLRLRLRFTASDEAGGLVHSRLTVRAADFEDSLEVMVRVAEEAGSPAEPPADS